MPVEWKRKTWAPGAGGWPEFDEHGQRVRTTECVSQTCPSRFSGHPCTRERGHPGQHLSAPQGSGVTKSQVTWVDEHAD